jgi:hypothetical protein
MVMAVILVMGLAAALLGALSHSYMKNQRIRDTSATLQRAKEALIGYAITYADNNPPIPSNPAGNAFGYLPCPDLNASGVTDEGIQHGTCGPTDVNSIGRFPWKSLGLPALRDSDGECLWYAVSGSYKNYPKTSTAMNWDNTGKLQLFDSSGTEVLANEIVAVIIAPHGPSSTMTQDRSGTSAPICGGNYNPAAYLDNDTTHSINNGSSAPLKFILPHEDRDASNNLVVSVNDQIVYITRDDIWPAIQSRIAKVTKTCLDDYANGSNGKYPWAAPVADPNRIGHYSSLFGRIPVSPDTSTSTLPPTPPVLLNLENSVNQLQNAVNACINDGNAGNGANLNAAADAVLAAVSSLSGSPYSNALTAATSAKPSPVGTAAVPCDYIHNHSTNNSIITNVVNAVSAVANAVAGTSSSPPSDSAMLTTWPASCNMFADKYWTDWANLIFYQVAEPYSPGGSKNCASGSGCLTIGGSGSPYSGPNSRAAVIVAGKAYAAQSRTNPNDNPPDAYLSNATSEIDPSATYNSHNNSALTTTFRTYSAKDANARVVNDLVLCLDGKNFCP